VCVCVCVYTVQCGLILTAALKSKGSTLSSHHSRGNSNTHNDDSPRKVIYCFVPEAGVVMENGLCCDNFVIGYFWSVNGRLSLASWRTLYREQVIRTSKLRYVRVTNALDTRPNRLLCSRGPLMAAVFAAILPKCSNLAVSTHRTIHSTRCLEHTPTWAVLPRTLNNSFVRCMESLNVKCTLEAHPNSYSY